MAATGQQDPGEESQLSDSALGSLILRGFTALGAISHPPFTLFLGQGLCPEQSQLSSLFPTLACQPASLESQSLLLASCQGTRLRMSRLSPEVSLENQYCLDCLMGKSMLIIRKPR